ncbi:PREDICTED: probable carboxylesterase 2 [Ipomoea nil]|uniref:probable carboxylesterase 2 n=1 Tax=Ipomoea nil TaxID=35883 RepID=UPI000900FE07|nr:PREDICTED: probable carboxylesterase 2 [Ipomoea nil]
MGQTGSSDEILHDLFCLMKIHKDGRVERLSGTDVVPAGLDAVTGVLSKDVVISPEPKVSARLYLPPKIPTGGKLPLLLYFHGGAFVTESAFSPTYMKPLNLLAAEANVLIVSVDFRLAPEHPLPAAYDDGWTALKWAASHAAGDGGEEWLNQYADFDGGVFLGGDSVGANISHHLALRVGSTEDNSVDGVKINGLFFNCPVFWGEEKIGDEAAIQFITPFVETMWKIALPEATGFDDPRINPAKDPELGKLGCKRVLIYVAEKDVLKHRGWQYKEALVSSGWQGAAEVVEVNGEHHIFSLTNPTCNNAMAMLKNLATFFHHSNP